MDFPACDRFHSWSKPFAGSIDRVRSHRIAYIVDEMNDKEAADERGVDHPNFEVAGTAAKFFEDGVDRIGFGQELGFVLVELELRLFYIRGLDHLHLPDHERLGGGGCETPAGAGKFCHK